jgi:hypothetical protein
MKCNNVLNLIDALGFFIFILQIILRMQMSPYLTSRKENQCDIEATEVSGVTVPGDVWGDVRVRNHSNRDESSSIPLHMLLWLSWAPCVLCAPC